MTLAFSPEEYTTRQNRLIARMEEEKLDAIVLFAQESLYWLTGYETFGFCLFQCLVMTKDGQKFLLTRLPELRQAKATSNIENIIIWRDREQVNPALDLRNLLNELGLLGMRIGVEYQTHGLTAADGHLVDAQLNSFAKIIDISGLVDQLRLIKSKQEIEYIRKAAALTDDVYDAALKKIKKGARETDILASMISANITGGGNFPPNDYIIGSGANALLCRSTSERRKLSTNEQLTMEWAGVYRRYAVPMMRTVLTGKPTQRHEELYQAAHEALLAIEECLRPGNTFADPFDAYVRTLETRDVTRHRFDACGYSVGARFAPSWMEMQHFQAGNQTIIQTDMTLFAHAMLFDSESNTAMTLARTYLITPDGNKPLSRHSLDLIIK